MPNGPLMFSHDQIMNCLKTLWNVRHRKKNTIELASKLWIEFNTSIGKVFCKICREKSNRFVFAKQGSVNIKVSAFQDHVMFDEHRRLTWAIEFGQKIIVKSL